MDELAVNVGEILAVMTTKFDLVANSKAIMRTDDVLRRNSELQARVYDALEQFRSKINRLQVSLRNATVKVVVVVRKCISTTRRARSVRRSAAKKAGGKNSAGSSDGPAAPLSNFNQQYQQYPSRAILAQIVLSRGAI